MRYTYSTQNRPYYERAYDILVKLAGARDSADERESFLMAFTQVEHPCTEYRFQGSLGFGGKFRRAYDRVYVDQYREDETPETRATINATNRALAALGNPP